MLETFHIPLVKRFLYVKQLFINKHARVVYTNFCDKLNDTICINKESIFLCIQRIVAFWKLLQTTYPV